jgi:SAM-dependent methyltransferase
VALARRGYHVDAVDISQRLIAHAQSVSDAPVQFAALDARDQLPQGPYHLVLCLYDVIGSAADTDSDEAILRNVRAVIADDGVLVLSVMNTHATLEDLAPERRPRSVQEFVAALEQLPPSTTMQHDGSIFDPHRLLYYDGIYYRKEQFDLADWRLPTELIVRDKRYDAPELEQLLTRSGFRVDKVLGVRAGKWSAVPPLDPADPQAKEILVVASVR